MHNLKSWERAVLVLVAIGVLAALATAYWPEPAVGRKAQVVLNTQNGRTYGGTIVEFSPGHLILESGGDQWFFPMDKIRLVQILGER